MCVILEANKSCFLGGTSEMFLVSSLAQTIEDLEKEMLNGQKLQGPATAAEVHLILKHKNLIDK